MAETCETPAAALWETAAIKGVEVTMTCEVTTTVCPLLTVVTDCNEVMISGVMTVVVVDPGHTGHGTTVVIQIGQTFEVLNDVVIAFEDRVECDDVVVAFEDRVECRIEVVV